MRVSGKSASSQNRGIIYAYAANKHLDHHRYWGNLLYLIDRFVRDGRLGNLLKILVALICLAAIVQRVLPALGVSF